MPTVEQLLFHGRVSKTVDRKGEQDKKKTKFICVNVVDYIKS